MRFLNWPESYPYIREHQRKMQGFYVKKMCAILNGRVERGRLLQLLKNLEEEKR